MPYPHFEDSDCYEDAMQDLRTQQWLEQQRRNGEIDDQLDFEGDDDGGQRDDV